jgi:outer membrane biosynthesis protein TonB
MQITINTDNLTDLDRKVLATILGLGLQTTVPTEEPEPAKKEQPKKAAAKAEAKTEPEPEPTPEPMAEEPVEETEESVEEDEQSDEDLLALAVKKATEMVAKGGAAEVREALDAAGASRVRELNKDNVREFFKALS